MHFGVMRICYLVVWELWASSLDCFGQPWIVMRTADASAGLDQNTVKITSEVVFIHNWLGCQQKWKLVQTTTHKLLEQIVCRDHHCWPRVYYFYLTFLAPLFQCLTVVCVLQLCPDKINRWIVLVDNGPAAPCLKCPLYKLTIVARTNVGLIES